MPETANIPYLPPEVLVPIIAYSEETQCCLINLLSKGSLKCEEPHVFTTVVYTRGDRDQDGNYTRGSIEALPFQHRCVYGTVRENSEPVIPINQADDLSVELQRWHLTKRVLVMDIGSEEDIRKEVQRILREHWSKRGASNINDVFSLINSSIQAKLNFWDKRIFDTIPLANNNGNGGIKLEIDNRAYTNRLRNEDSQLACERIRHLMIRPVFNYMDKVRNVILDELEEQLGEYHSAINLSLPIASNYYRAMDFMLRLDWHLLKNLEVLCLDLTGVDPHWRYLEIQASFVEMGRHLKVKTLILLGASGLARYDDKGKEAWVAALEDDEYDEASRFHPKNWGDNEKPSLISVLKETLRPGGQIHFIDFLKPGDPWSSCSEEENPNLDNYVIELVAQELGREWLEPYHSHTRRDS
jgi:hypothetical protein